MATLKTDNVKESTIGGEHGITEAEINALKEKTEEIHDWLMKSKQENSLPFLNLPYQTDSVEETLKAAEHIRKNFDNFVILGIGGSALGPIAIHNALNDAFYNLKSAEKRRGPRLFVADNSDPRYFTEILNEIDFKKTCFNVITKSGSTSETMSQFMVVYNLLKQEIGENWKHHLILTTDPENGTLRKIAKTDGLKTLPIDPGVGGRFTIFTPVGLLPAAVIGVDIKRFLKGAATAVEKSSTTNLNTNIAYSLAIISYLADVKKGKKILVMMPYANALYSIADWFRQMWAESLGKRKDLQGNDVYTGQTPVKALGATDQHSQVQLYVEGPNDKITFFIEIDDYGTDVTIPKVYENESSLSYLVGKTFEQLIKTEKEGTEHALTVNNRPNLTLKINSICEEEVGELFMTFAIQTAFAGKLYNVNAFDQPGVEWGKDYVYKKFGKEGY
ncbi:MAG: glucose-6-phosphate isomerase [Nitrospinae bacterium]|nr:glucose-6-phosphate isomerase [Nitrospinota bacterium]